MKTLPIRILPFLIFVIAAWSLGIGAAQEKGVFEILLQQGEREEWTVPDEWASFEIQRVIGGAVLISAERPGETDPDAEEDAPEAEGWMPLEAGWLPHPVTLARGGRILLDQQDAEEHPVSVYGTIARNAEAETLRAEMASLRETVREARAILGEDLAAAMGLASRDLHAEMERSVDALNETAAVPAREITDAIDAFYEIHWKYKVVEIEFKDVFELKVKLEKKGEPGLELVQLISDRRPSMHRGVATAIYKHAVKPERRAKLPAVEAPQVPLEAAP